MRSLVLTLFLLGIGSQTNLFAQCNTFLVSSPHIIQTNCGGTANVCTTLASDDETSTRFLLDNQPINTTSPCAFDTLRYYPLSGIIAIGSFAPYYLNDWEINGTSYSTEFIYVSQLIDSMNVWDPNGNWRFRFVDGAIFGGNPQNEYSDLDIDIIINNTTISSDYTIDLIPTHLGVELPLGLHLLVAWNIAEQCRDSLVVNVVCTEPSRLSLTLEQGQSRIICLETNELIREVDDIRNISVSPQHYTWEDESEACVQFNGRSIGSDVAQLVICDEFGICDTTRVNIEVREPMNRTYYRAVLVGAESEFCVDRAVIAMPSPIEQFSEACGGDGGILEAAYNIDDLCVNYKGVAKGKTEECIQICDRFGNCDTLSLNVNVVEPTLVYDTLLVGAETGSYCLDVSAFDMESLRVERSCIRENSIIKFNENTLCFSYESETIETDSTCVWLIDDAGNASYIVLKVEVSRPVPSIVRDSVFINQSMEICINRDELPGQLRTIENLCPENAGTAIEIVPISEDCVEVTGLQLGEGEGCFVLCDNFGYCDTTYLRIRVVPYLEFPIAEDDFISTNQSTSIQIPIQINDNILGGVERIRIIVPPQYGQAYVETDGQVTYVPDSKNCIGSDMFQYEICNSVGCDVATVNVTVTCAGVEIFTAMSPNGDGLNDALFITNIDAYPNNTLKVYNRRGALVYEQNNYQNDWFGTWDGRILPDGTYFYLLEIEENGVEQVHRGYVELHR